jgi:hypothetical protein
LPAALRGIVLDHGTGRPLARTRVRIEGVPGRPAGISNSILSDSYGAFSFPDLPAAAYLLSAERPGYARSRYGQKTWDGPATPIVLEATSEYSAQLRLRKLGVISGEIVDENDVGIPGFPVYAYLVGTRLKLAGTGQTDDRGAFRIAGLEPGKYYIRTAAKELEDRQGYQPTWFGRATTTAAARTIEVSLDQEIAGIHIVPLPGKLAKLAVTLSGTAGATLALHADTGRREARVEAGQTFVFDQLAAGTYTLTAESMESGLANLIRVIVNSDSHNVVIELPPAPALRVGCEHREGRALNLASISIFVRRTDPPEDTPRRITCGLPARLPPGEWEIAAAPPPEYYVGAVRGARAAGNSHEFGLSAGQEHHVTLVFGSAPARVRGKVRTPDGEPAIGAPVFLFTRDPELRGRLGGVRTARTGQSGEFWFTGLPAGRYEVLSSFVFRDIGEAISPEIAGKGVSLDEGTEVEVELVLADPS